MKEKSGREPIYRVAERLPAPGQRCICFGYHTYCCSEDMDEEPGWYEVVFTLVVSEYKLKDEVTKEMWICVGSDEHGHVIGVTQWMNKST